jgi:iron complex transport system permease protein
MSLHVSRQRKSRVLKLSFAIVALVVVCFLSLAMGASSFSLQDVLENEQARMIVLDIRLPRFLFSALVGAALALIGVVYQTLFRNPLASPFTLGVSSGAALGASIVLLFPGFLGSVEAGAMGGAILSILSILAISRRLSQEGGGALLLVGVIFSFFCSSLLTMAQYLSDYSQLFRATRWMMGGVPIVGYGDLTIGLLGTIALFLWLQRRHREFDLMLFGDELASVKGVEAQRLYEVVFILSSVAIGWIVAQCGVIGFVGIIVPAIARYLVGLSHRHVFPLSCILGAVLVSLCDFLGRVVRPPFEVPAGVFTAVLGGPIFIFLAIRRTRLSR